jgi:hypothetical protein
MLTFFLINVCKYQIIVVPLYYRNKDSNNGEPEAKESPKGMGNEL